ncbi:protein suppressor of hairy wing-like [Coccinella septempunctata]|uniref:protein suppressor of hairy wing-like n=1 Tax=Coccinella septempunctata TaxID=41139 RepID=UPI001D062B1B|nr:protein suppressor of hairy wing-like [Coccinella septempunctata]
MEEDRSNVLRNMQICRLCLNSDGNLSSIYDETRNKKKLPLYLQIMACVNVEVYKNDGMPELICDDCKYLISLAYGFRINCKKANEALKSFATTGNLNKSLTINKIQKEKEAKIRKINTDLLGNPAKKFKPDTSEPPAQTNPISVEFEDDEHALEEYEIRPSSDNAFSVKLVSSNKTGDVEISPLRPKTFHCSMCEMTFPMKQLLDIHMRNHEKKDKASKYEEENQFSCEVCKKEFSDEDSLHRHEKSHETNYTCYCGVSFGSRDDLLEHSKKKHGQRKPFTCGECGKSFVFKQGLENHIATHNADKPHKCNYCEAFFTSPIKLTRHLTSHAVLRPYPCKFCKRTFLLSHHLTRHMRSHFAARSNNLQQIGQHKCDICSMSFRRKDSLINHSAIHSMVNLKCVICYTEFENAQAVKEHISTHLSGLPFPCEKCSYSFESKDQLEEHELKHAEMEYEEQIEKEVVEEARAQGQISGDLDSAEDDDEEFGGDHMGRTGDDDEDYVMDEDEEMSFHSSFASQSESGGAVRRSTRQRKTKRFTDFLKSEPDSDPEQEEYQEQAHSSKDQVHQTAEQEADTSQDEEDGFIKPIFRREGVRMYQRKTPVRRPKILNSIPMGNMKTAPLSQINQPQVTTIENLGLTTKDLEQLPTEKYVNMKIGNKTVRVQKLVLTKEEMKAMAREGKIRGNTVLIKNPGPQASNKVDLSPLLEDPLPKDPLARISKSYQKKTTASASSSQNTLIINDIIIDNIEDQDNRMDDMVNLS